MNRRRSLTRTLGLTAALPAMVFGTAMGAWSAPADRGEQVPESLLAEYTAPEPLGLSAELADAQGRIDVAVTLSEPAIGDVLPEGALQNGEVPSTSQQRKQLQRVEGQQDKFVREARGQGAKELARTSLASNVVFVSVDADELEALAANSSVQSITGVGRFEKHENTDHKGKPGKPGKPSAPVSGSLAQANDYLQTSALHKAGITGKGVRIAVLDSGIDFTHANLGGPGTQAAVDTCFAQASSAPSGLCAGFFGPKAPKVKGGYDFVGDTWPDTPETPDPNPIDSGPEGGHGTSVADIAAGRSADGKHKGIAPDASLYALKVCSSVSTSCSGIAILQGLDWALDPNGDGDISDAVDVVNLSLGASFGQEENPTVPAVDNLVRAGVVVVASAGNSADRPFIAGSPSTAAGAISVAQTALPDDLQWVIAPSVGAQITNAAHQSWSPLPTGLVSGALATPSEAQGCTPADFTGFPAGAIALISRGTCNVSDKAVNAQHAGAIATIIYNNVPGDPPSFSFGSTEPVTIPTFTISQADGARLVSEMAAGTVSVTLDPANAIKLTNTIVGTSSRGTAMGNYRAKPDIGAPGSWLAANTQTGTEVSNFGGTSGAAPVVTGVSALVLQKHKRATPLEVKARLLNGANNANQTPASGGWYTTPISRIGSGEVRGTSAVNASGWLSTTGLGGHVGFGIPSVTSSKQTYKSELTITNTTKKSQTYKLRTSFRDEADKQQGATWKISPSSVKVPAGKTKKVKVELTLAGKKLDSWAFNNVGAIGGDGAALNGPELDGYITATAGKETLKLGWTVLPRKAAHVKTASTVKVDRSGNAKVKLSNRSAIEAGDVEVFSLTGTSPRLPNGGPGAPGSDAAVIDIAAVGVYADAGIVQFAVANHHRYTIPNYPIEYDIYVDSNNDGTADYVVFQTELGGFAATGQSVVYIVDLATGQAGAYFYTDAGFDSSMMVLTAPAAALGLTPGQTFAYDVYAFDNYFTGNLTDQIEGMSFTYGQPKYVVDDYITVPARRSASLPVAKNPSAGDSTQTGLLLRHLSAAKSDFSVVTVNESGKKPGKKKSMKKPNKKYTKSHHRSLGSGS